MLVDASFAGSAARRRCEVHLRHRAICRHVRSLSRIDAAVAAVDLDYKLLDLSRSAWFCQVVAVADLFDLSGKVAVITGGAGGIGAVYAAELCDAGASVVVADLDVDAALHREAAGYKGHRAVPVAVDVCPRSRPQQWQAADVLDGIDILINNAAIMTDLPPYGLGNMPVRKIGTA